jgi:CxxC-x17-CxxC domain-containing protein
MKNQYHSNYRSRSGNDRKGDRPMFQATCDNCGNSCTVPFKPSGDKPVYCSSCFEKANPRDSRPHNRYNSKNSYKGSDRRSSRMYDAVCDNCGKNCEVPFQPSSDKPIYCKECFGNKRTTGEAPRTSGSRFQSEKNVDTQVLSEVKKLTQHIHQLETKLDRVLVHLAIPLNDQPQTKAQLNVTPESNEDLALQLVESDDKDTTKSKTTDKKKKASKAKKPTSSKPKAAA